MYQQDWILRQIENTIRLIAKLVLKRDIVEYQIIDEDLYSATNLLHKEILELLEALKINEAENLLFSRIDTKNNNYIELALDFYHRINQLSDEELIKGNFTREEIKEGMDDLLKIYGISIPYIE